MNTIRTVTILCALAACAFGAAVEQVKESPFSLAPMGPYRSTWLGRLFEGSLVEKHIVGGKDAKLGEFPHQVSMQYVQAGIFKDYAPQHICGGTLIARNWVLTAAHCLYGLPSEPKRVEVVVGIANLAKEGSGSQRVRVTQMLAHDKYDSKHNNGVGPYDIALLKLDKEVTLSEFVKIASLPTEGAIPSGEAILSGWGSTSKDHKSPVYPDQLQAMAFPIVDFKACYKYISYTTPGHPNPLADHNVCTGNLKKSGQSSCSGDSGGPLVQKEGDKAVVIGVVSWGQADCGRAPFPSVYTRVSAFIPWIRSAMAN